MSARTPLARTSRRIVVAAVVVVLSLVTSARADAPPRGPALGTVRYAAEIRSIDGEPDVDTFAASLIEGERLSVCVTSERSSALRPALEFVDADGRPLSVPTVTTRRGRRATVRTFVVASTGLYGVRVSGVDGSEGRYNAQFRIRSRGRAAAERVEFSAVTGAIQTIPFESVDGAALHVLARSRSRGARVSVLRVVTPAGFAAPGLSNALRRHGRSDIVAGLALSGGAGEYGIVVGAEADVARAAVRVNVAPPRRPRGRIELAGDEPALLPVAAPLAARMGERLALPTRHVQPTAPPRVLLGGIEAAVLRVSDAGDVVEVRVPNGLTRGAIVRATLIAPDGQANSRERHVRVIEVEFLDLSGWTLVQTGSARTFTFPTGTVVATGGYAVVARDAARTDFESHWGVALGTHVRYLRATEGGAAEFPSINGSETFALLDADGGMVDGETIALRSPGHESLARIAGEPPGDPASWVFDGDAVGIPTPGSGQPEDGPAHGVFISEISDAAGSGTFQNEFVEVYFGGSATR